MFIFYILFFPALILSTNQQQIAALFQVSLFGIEFSPVNSSDLISIQTGVHSVTRCVMACLINIECYTVGYDSSSFLCRLFAVWVYEGTIIQSASLPTSRIAYIEQKPILYFLYGQFCNASYAVNRFLWCINGQWHCPTGQFFNGSICRGIPATTTITTTTTTPILTCSCFGNCTAYSGSPGYPAACGNYAHDNSGYFACVYDADNGYISGSSNDCQMCCILGNGTFSSV